MICKVSFCSFLVLRKAYVRACAHWIWYNNESTCNFIGTQVLIFLGSQTNSILHLYNPLQLSSEKILNFGLHSHCMRHRRNRTTHLRTDLNRYAARHPVVWSISFWANSYEAMRCGSVTGCCCLCAEIQGDGSKVDLDWLLLKLQLSAPCLAKMLRIWNPVSVLRTFSKSSTGPQTKTRNSETLEGWSNSRVVVAYENSFADLEFTEGKRFFCLLAFSSYLPNTRGWQDLCWFSIVATRLFGQPGRMQHDGALTYCWLQHSKLSMHWHVQPKRRLMKWMCDDSAVKSNKLATPSSNMMESRKPESCRGSFNSLKLCISPGNISDLMGLELMYHLRGQCRLGKSVEKDRANTDTIHVRYIFLRLP